MQTPQPTPEVEDHALIARCKAGADGVAISPCAFELPRAGDATFPNLYEIQVTPAGAFKPRDGRSMRVPAWRIDGAIAAQVIARWRANKTPLVLDYEHQTLQAEDNGQPAPAAGFFRDLFWREGQGLFAVVELTERAREFVTGGEYRYFSPVFRFDTDTGAIEEILMGALTNNPAIDGMQPFALRAAARFALHTEDPVMKNKLLLAVCAALAIAFDNRAEADVEADAIAALGQLKDTPDPLAAVRKELGLADDKGAEEIVAACGALKARAVDPAKYVPIAAVQDMQTQLAALTASQRAREVDDLVKPAFAAGKLLPAQEEWARTLGKADLASLKAYLDCAPAIAALGGSQTGGRNPAADNEHGLSAEDLAVCTACGLDPKDFVAARQTA